MANPEAYSLLHICACVGGGCRTQYRRLCAGCGVNRWHSGAGANWIGAGVFLRLGGHLRYSWALPRCWLPVSLGRYKVALPSQKKTLWVALVAA